MLVNYSLTQVVNQANYCYEYFRGQIGKEKLIGLCLEAEKEHISSYERMAEEFHWHRDSYLKDSKKGWLDIDRISMGEFGIYIDRNKKIHTTWIKYCLSIEESVSNANRGWYDEQQPSPQTNTMFTNNYYLIPENEWCSKNTRNERQRLTYFNGRLLSYSPFCRTDCIIADVLYPFFCLDYVFGCLDKKPLIFVDAEEVYLFALQHPHIPMDEIEVINTAWLIQSDEGIKIRRGLLDFIHTFCGKEEKDTLVKVVSDYKLNKKLKSYQHL